jgi:hypothetical protein
MSIIYRFIILIQIGFALTLKDAALPRNTTK